MLQEKLGGGCPQFYMPPIKNFLVVHAGMKVQWYCRKSMMVATYIARIKALYCLHLQLFLTYFKWISRKE